MTAPSLLRLPETLREAIADRSLTVELARVIAALPAEEQRAIADAGPPYAVPEPRREPRMRRSPGPPAPLADERDDQSPEPYRCRRDWRCGERVPLVDEDGYPSGEWVGAALSARDGLCSVCISAVSSALGHLELDVVELTCLIGRLPDGSTLEATRIALSAPGPLLPIREHVEALRALIVHEACSWAGSVARLVGVNWTVPADYHARIERTPRACALLRRQVPTLLALGLTEHRARSLTARRADGHDERITTVFGDDIWTNRTGLAGAVLLLELHEMAWSLAARADRSEPMHLRCTNCGYQALRHQPGEDEVWCTHCRDRRPWEDYCVLREHIIAHQAAFADRSSAA